MSRIIQVLLMLNCSNLISLLSPARINKPGFCCLLRGRAGGTGRARLQQSSAPAAQTAAIYIPGQGKSQGHPAAVKHHWILNGKQGVFVWAMGVCPVLCAPPLQQSWQTFHPCFVISSTLPSSWHPCCHFPLPLTSSCISAVFLLSFHSLYIYLS